MPARPRSASFYRTENAPGIAFEEVRVVKVDQDVAGPSGNIGGAIEVNELHMDGIREGKVFAPGYGEFSTGGPNGDLEAVRGRRPRRRQGAAPGEFATLSTAVNALYEAAAGAEDAARFHRGSRTQWGSGILCAPREYHHRWSRRWRVDISPSSEDVQSAALRVVQNELDLRLLYEPVIDVDLARLKLWIRQVPIHVAADDTGVSRGQCGGAGQSVGAHPSWG